MPFTRTSSRSYGGSRFEYRFALVELYRELQHRRRLLQRKRQFQNEFPFFQSSWRLFQFAENGKCRRISLEFNFLRTALNLRERKRYSSSLFYVLHKTCNQAFSSRRRNLQVFLSLYRANRVISKVCLHISFVCGLETDLLAWVR